MSDSIVLFVSLDDLVATDIRKLRMKCDDFTQIKVIGRGAFGEVQLVRENQLSVIFY